MTGSSRSLIPAVTLAIINKGIEERQTSRVRNIGIGNKCGGCIHLDHDSGSEIGLNGGGLCISVSRGSGLSILGSDLITSYYGKEASPSKDNEYC